MKILILGICSILAMISCSNSKIEYNNIIYKYNELTNYADEVTTSFLFFTDPHLNENNNVFKHYMRTIESVYKQLSLDFCLCGGDWLDSGDTNEQAYYKLKFIDNYMYSLFNDKYYHILGNHDTNYQGRSNENAPIKTGTLEHKTIVDLMFYKFGNSYYSFNKNWVRFFIFDTGLDWEPQMNDFRWEQIHWFAKELCNNDIKNIVIAMHMYTNNDLKTPVDFSKKIMEVSEAYNSRTQILLTEKSYDFSEAIGNISCVLCGHSHADFISYEYKIPIVGTTRLKSDNVPTFDLCVFNWEQKRLNLLRVGAGYDRVVRLGDLK